MIPLAKVNDYENLFNDCVFMRRYLDQNSDEALGAAYNGDAAITTDFTGKQSKVLTLDGTGDYVDYGNRQETNFGTGDFSLEVVFKTSSASTILSKRGGVAAGNVGYDVRITGGGNLAIEISDGTDEITTTSGSTYNDNTYYHGVIALDKSANATIYVNGSADGSEDISAVDNISNTDSLLVGQLSGLNDFNGQIALVRLWEKVLSADEVSQLAATEGFGTGTPLFGYEKRNLVSYWPPGNIQGTAVNDIVGSNHLTAVSMSEANLVAGYNQYRNALDFDGTEDTIYIADNASLSITADMTISAWIKTVKSGAQQTFVAKYYATENKRTFEFRMSTTNKLELIISSNGNDIEFETGSDSINDGRWHNVALVYNATANTVDFYIGGSADSGGTQTFTTITGALDDNDSEFSIGALKQNGIRWFDGSMCDVLIWNATRTALEIELLNKRQLRGLKI